MVGRPAPQRGGGAESGHASQWRRARARRRANSPAPITTPSASSASMSPSRCSRPIRRVTGRTCTWVRKGTRLRCVKLERWFSSDTVVYRVSAEILTGDLKGKTVFLVPWGDPRKKGSLELGPSPLVHPLDMSTAGHGGGSALAAGPAGNATRADQSAFCCCPHPLDHGALKINTVKTGLFPAGNSPVILAYRGGGALAIITPLSFPPLAKAPFQGFRPAGMLAARQEEALEP